MQDKEKVKKLINDLLASDEKKKELLEKIEIDGATPEILEEIRGIVDTSVANFEQEATKKIGEIQQKLDETVEGFQNLFDEIDADVKKAQKEKAKAQDVAEIEKIRKQISGS